MAKRASGMPEAQRPGSSPIEANDYGDLQSTRSATSNGPDWQARRVRPCHVTGLAVVLALVGCLPPSAPSPPPTPSANCCEPPAGFILNAGWRVRTDPDDPGTAKGVPMFMRAGTRQCFTLAGNQSIRL